MKAPFSILALLLVALPISAAEPVTFNKDVAPILWKNCAECHRPGEVGPFSLLNYKDAAKRAKFLVEVTTSGQMPPWKAEPNFGTFRDARILTVAEKKILSDWAASGAPEGDAADLPKPPEFTQGWQNGPPDLIVKMPEAFTVPAAGRDIQQCFVIPIPTDEDRTLSAVEFRPGSRSVVHHAILYLDSTGTARKLDEQSKEPGYRTGGGPGFIPTGGLGSWTPGAMVRHLPEGTGKYLKKGSDLVMQIHYHPNGKEEKDQSQVGLYFTKKPATKIVGGIALRSRALLIPAGEKRYRAGSETEPLPADVDVISAAPHMHNVGREMKVVAILPDKTEVPLIWIRDWDFNWQGSYTYEKPVRLPKGTVVKMEAFYDNSTDNPKNPSNPPKLVRWGEQTTDEMCLFGLQVVTDTKADLKAIMSMRNNRLGALLGSSPPREVLDDATKKSDFEFPKGGLPIPEKLRELAKKWDLDEDGKLSKEEFEKLPPLVKERIGEMLKKK